MSYFMFKNKKYASVPFGAKNVPFNNAKSNLAATNVQDAIDEVNSNLKWQLIADTKSTSATNIVEFDCTKYSEVLVVGYRNKLTVNALVSAVYPVDLYNQGGYTGLIVQDTSNMVVFYKDSDYTAHLYVMIPEIPLLNGCAIYAR